MRTMTPLLLLAVAALLAIAPRPAAAQGSFNIAWNNCVTQPNAATTLNYACDGSRNGIPFRAVPSFIAPDNLTAFVGVQAVLEFYVATWPNDPPGAVLPDYWRLGVGECRDGMMTYPFSMTGVGTGTTGACQNPWGSNFGGGLQWTSEVNRYQFPWPGHATLKLALARNGSASLIAGQQYLAGVIGLDTFGDVPNPDYPYECDGCCTPTYLVMRAMELYQVAGTQPQDIYYLSQAGEKPYIQWGGCLPTPTRRTTWGAIKATYR